MHNVKHYNIIMHGYYKGTLVGLIGCVVILTTSLVVLVNTTDTTASSFFQLRYVGMTCFSIV